MSTEVNACVSTAPGCHCLHTVSAVVIAHQCSLLRHLSNASAVLDMMNAHTAVCALDTSHSLFAAST